MMNLDEDANEQEEVSKTQIKREMDALQELGKRLTQLNQEQLKLVPMDDNLADAITEYQRLKKHEAKRRQLQYIGRLMRNTDAEAIAHAVHVFDASQAEHTQHFHLIERWREQLMADPGAVTQFISEFPQVDSQQLRQLIRNALKQQKQGKDLGGYKKLFRFIRDVLEN